jgi:hypothetical protein
MIYTHGSQIDLSKYKRFFAFGCSFTGYRWSTWADILHWQMPQAEYYNYGRSGAGQQYIFTQLNQAINHFNIGSDDLIAIMWSTFYREDRYIYGKGYCNWSTPGNLFTASHAVPQEYVDQYVCTRGLTIRDMALIDTTMRMLEHSSADSFAMLGVPLDAQQGYACVEPDSAIDISDVERMYAPMLENKLMPSLMSTQYPNGWTNEYAYYDDGMGCEFSDYHPSVRGYLEYLQKLGFVVDHSVAQQVQSEHEYMLSVTHKNQLREHTLCTIL